MFESIVSSFNYPLALRTEIGWDPNLSKNENFILKPFIDTYSPQD